MKNRRRLIRDIGATIVLLTICTVIMLYWYPHAQSVLSLVLYIVPIVFAALQFGIAGGLITALPAAVATTVAVFIISPELALRSAGLSVFVFLGIGSLVGYLSRIRNRLKENEATLSTLWDSSPAGIFLVDPGDHTIHRANDTVLEMLGASREEVIGSQCFDHLCQALPGVCPITDLGYKAESTERSFRNKAGEEIPILKSVRFVNLGGKEYLLEACVDITKLKETEEELREAEERYRSLFHRMPVALFRSTSDGEFLEANQAFVEMLGYANSDMILKMNAETLYVNPNDRKDLVSMLNKDRRVDNFETELNRDDGQKISTSIYAHQIINEANGKVHFEGSILNMSERKELDEQRAVAENQRQRAERMSAVAELAAGVAHEFNNILAGIRLQTQVVGLTGVSDDRRTKSTGSILSAVDRASGVLEGLLSAIGNTLLAAEEVDLRSIVSDSFERAAASLSETVEISLITSDDPIPITLDPDAVGQCIAELITNAERAINIGGRIAVSCAIEPLERSILYTPPDNGGPGSYACVSVTDDGIGIDEKNINRIFEPYFTTQEFGKSAGIGLTVVYGIVNQHGGLIGVRSSPGKGTTIKLYFPVNEKSYISYG